jgi:hypothetical protein
MKSLRVLKPLFQSALILTMTTSFCWPAAASPSQKDTAVAEAAVKTCVTQVNSPTSYGFDAYYNSANGLVQNNSPSIFSDIYEAQKWQHVLFVFDKCMAEQGVPLTAAK